MTASYSASLLEARKPNLRAYSVSIPSGEVMISPAPLPWALAAPSTDNFQVERSGASWVASVVCAEVNSMKKSAKIYPFTAALGLYLMSNSLSSIAHFISLPEVSDLCSICFIGYSVGTSTFILSGFAYIPRLLTMKPKNFLAETPKAHLAGFSFIL